MHEHFFVSCEGQLFNSRVGNWFKRPPLRLNYRITHDSIDSVQDFKATLRAGEYAWPGGYPLFFITSDGAALSFKTARKEFRRIAESIRDRSHDGWRVVACTINYEDSELYDDHSNEKIEAAYTE